MMSLLHKVYKYIVKHTHIMSVWEQEALGGKMLIHCTSEGFTLFCKVVFGHKQRSVTPPILPEERDLFV